eukprot:3364004-Rhodomonas_salina.3
MERLLRYRPPRFLCHLRYRRSAWWFWRTCFLWCLLMLSRTSYVMPGTDVAYAATRQQQQIVRSVLFPPSPLARSLPSSLAPSIPPSILPSVPCSPPPFPCLLECLSSSSLL